MGFQESLYRLVSNAKEKPLVRNQQDLVSLLDQAGVSRKRILDVAKAQLLMNLLAHDKYRLLLGYDSKLQGFHYAEIGLKHSDGSYHLSAQKKFTHSRIDTKDTLFRGFIYSDRMPLREPLNHVTNKNLLKRVMNYLF